MSITKKNDVPKTVNGPSPDNSSTNPAAVTASTNVVKSSFSIATSTILPSQGSGRGSSSVPSPPLLFGQHNASAMSTVGHMTSFANSVAAYSDAMVHVVPSSVGKIRSGNSTPSGLQKLHMISSILVPPSGVLSPVTVGVGIDVGKTSVGAVVKPGAIVGVLDGNAGQNTGQAFEISDLNIIYLLN